MPVDRTHLTASVPEGAGEELGCKEGGSRLGDAQSLIISPAPMTTLGRDKDMILQIFVCLTKYLAMLECQLTSKSDKVSE